jgi:hypothetical protein
MLLGDGTGAGPLMTRSPPGLGGGAEATGGGWFGAQAETVTAAMMRVARMWRFTIDHSGPKGRNCAPYKLGLHD